MAGKFVNEGRNKCGLVYIANGTPRGADSLYLGLYLDTTEPLVNITLATITELGLGGYSRLQLLDADWTVDSVGESTNLVKQWTAGELWSNVYGYFITDVASGTGGLMHWVEHFSDGPYTIANTKTLDVTAVITPS